jgi:2-amino-4-hydroxy-6-hydroxymethyldihydropteridine diphosphokinase
MVKSIHALVALGANLPFQGVPPEATLQRALKALSKEGLTVLAVSRFFATPCFPAGAGPDYVNAAAVLEVGSETDVASVMAILHRVEAQFGRRRETRWGMRTLDLDLLALGDSVLPDAATHDDWRNLAPEKQVLRAPDRLILPHPRLQDRAFVLVPLADVAPGWVHPRTGLNVAAMLAALSSEDIAAVKPL